jgi:hypothetical protein
MQEQDAESGKEKNFFSFGRACKEEDSVLQTGYKMKSTSMGWGEKLGMK